MYSGIGVLTEPNLTLRVMDTPIPFGLGVERAAE